MIQVKHFFTNPQFLLYLIPLMWLPIIPEQLFFVMWRRPRQLFWWEVVGDWLRRLTAVMKKSTAELPVGNQSQTETKKEAQAHDQDR